MPPFTKARESEVLNSKKQEHFTHRDWVEKITVALVIEKFTSSLEGACLETRKTREEGQQHISTYTFL